ncbi:6511_t:CDS:2 [Funneliformis mosseae]|uniref:6511_t:CDS:1 n=1 Tax=Funneliformis mosseae TaxID=27381 RepID=A0A9N9C1Z9_FUNMO|nr:6511_t:CDS:2 [Funneliformis mosseae]
MTDIKIKGYGKNGADGKDGKDGSIFSSSGRNAKPAEDGKDAKNMDLVLSSVKGSKVPGHIHITGTKGNQHYDKECFLDLTGMLHFIAYGGNGGDGGKGGDASYKNSTCEYRGHGGKGTKGGNGGDGGQIKITTNEHDSHLLTLIGKYDTNGGKGGKAGNHGNGNNMYDENLVNGRDGKNGTFKCGVMAEDGQWYEKSPVQTNTLKIKNLKYEPQAESGIYEPGSTFNITNMKLENIGSEPTPKHTLIRIELDSKTKWIKNHSIFAPLHIQPNNHKSLRMSVNINDCEAVDEEPLKDLVNLEFKAVMTKIERPYQISFEESFEFVIQYPIKMSEVTAIRTQSDIYVLFLSVSNISESAFGRHSNFGRQVRTVLTNDETINEEIDNQEIPFVEAGKSIQVTSKVKLNNDNSWHNFTVTLQIGLVDEPNKLKSIQRRRFKIKTTSKSTQDFILDASMNACENVTNKKKNITNKGLIDISLSYQFDEQTNLKKVLFRGSMNCNDGLNISLNNSFYFGMDEYIYIANSKHLQDYDETNEIINYRRPFKLRLHQIEIDSINDSGIIEPSSDNIKIKTLKLRNEGEMPTPNNYGIYIIISSKNNIIYNNILCTITESIQFNQIYELKNLICKRSRLNNPDINTFPLQIKEDIMLKAVLDSKINCTLQDFNSKKIDILIQHPILIDEFIGIRRPSATREIYNIFWKVKNISNIEVGKSSKEKRQIECFIYNYNNDDRLYRNEIKHLEAKSNDLLSTKIEIRNDFNGQSRFDIKLLIGTMESPEVLLPIQSYPFNLKPLGGSIYNLMDLVFDLNAGRLNLNDEQDDYASPGSVQLIISTPDSIKHKVGDIAIQGTLQYTNGWKININDCFSLGKTGMIHLYPNGKKDLFKGTIDIEIMQEDAELLYLIDSSSLDKCKNQLYKVITGSILGNQVHLYYQMYELTLVDFGFEFEDKNGIYEPGAIINVSYIRFKNTGGMPTPNNYKISIDSLISTGISLINDNSLHLSKSIEPAQEIMFTQDDEKLLEFQIIDQGRISKDKPLHKMFTVYLKALMLGIDREITFDFFKQVNVRYPIQFNDEIKSSVNSKVTRVSWILSNISQIDLGSKSKSRRIVKAQITIDKMIPENSLKFKSTLGLSIYLEQEILLLNGNQTKEMFCDLVSTLSENEQSIIEASVTISLCLGTIKSPHKVNNIEVRKKSIIISPSYKTNNKDDLLLVTNSKTTRKDIESWFKLCQELNLTVSLWDIKKEGHIDLLESNIMKDFSGKSIVVLNNEFEKGNSIIDLINPLQFYQAVNSHDIKFYIVGKTISDNKIKSLFIPESLIQKSDNSQITSKFNTIKNYVKVKQGVNPTQNTNFECINTSLRPITLIRMNSNSGSNHYTRQKVQKLSIFAEKWFNNRNIFISIIGNKRANDRIILCKTYDRTKRHLTYHNRDPKYPINSKTNKIGLLSCISFTKRLEQLQGMMFLHDETSNELLEIHKNLVEVDLAMEIISLCERLEFDSIPDDNLFKYFTFFNKFCMEFIVSIISKEGSLSAANSDWILNVLAKLEISVSFLNLFKLDQFIQMQYQKSFQLLIENNKILNFQSIKDTLNDKVNSMMKYWSKHFNRQSVQQNVLKFVKCKLLEFLYIEGNLKTEWNYLNDSMDIFLNEEEYNDYNKFHVIAHKINDEYSEDYKKEIGLIAKQNASLLQDIETGIVIIRTEKFNHGSEKLNKNHGSEETIKYLGPEKINENYDIEKINEKNFGAEYINENHETELVNEKNLDTEKINENHESESNIKE